MSTSRQGIWPIEPHTQAKHHILTYYLKAWFPILSQVSRRLLYVDGFAGPGEYSGGEPGSAILALKVATDDDKLRAQLTKPGMELVFVFIEKDEDTFADLERKVNEFKPNLPSNFRIEMRNSTFQHVVDVSLKELDEQNRKMAPSFIFVDPFGPTGFPMSLVERIVKQPSAEVLINFSYQPLNRWFLKDPSKHPRLDELFGDASWRDALSIPDPSTKEDFLVQQYRRALEARGWRGISFRMVNKHNQSQYYLIFGTKHYLGMLAMKSAMWKVDPEGTFSYSDLSNVDQPRLFSLDMDEDYSRGLAEQIFQRRRGTTAGKQSIIEDELAWHPTAIEKHLRRALIILEYESNPPKIVEVQKADASLRKARTYPKDCRITFGDSRPEDGSIGRPTLIRDRPVGGADVGDDGGDQAGDGDNVGAGLKPAPRDTGTPHYKEGNGDGIGNPAPTWNRLWQTSSIAIEEGSLHSEGASFVEGASSRRRRPRLRIKGATVATKKRAGWE
ncbi:MAG: three-Cys-motif partner protein TcmP [Chloroflexi bacterium]|nr:three-Cys-motif partner protein TcmP [Chloroflexota bacterium]